MGIQCVICKYHYQKGCGISFHSFPKDDMYRTLWLKACRQIEIQPSFRVCSTHFTTDNFESHEDYAKKTLKKSAIPTVGLFKQKKQSKELIVTREKSEKPETVPIPKEMLLQRSNDETHSAKSRAVLKRSRRKGRY